MEYPSIIYNNVISRYIDRCNVIHPKGVCKYSNDTIVVVMSRKMVRLLDYILQSGEYEIPHPVITEHALPFYKGKCKDKKFVVLDDSMFYGATLNNIKQIISAIKETDDDIEFYPIVARNRKAAEDLCINENLTCFIEEKDVPLYTYQNSRNMLSLNSPMEVEYPILTFKRKLFSLRKIDIKVILQKHFPGKDVYEVAHVLYDKNKGNYPLSNYTVLLNAKSDSYNFDFAKLRIYLDADTIKVVPIAPIVLSNEILKSDLLSIFDDTSFYGIWEDIKKSLNIDYHKLIYSNKEEKNEFDLRQNKTLAVCANYLASFSKLLEVRDKLNHFLEELDYGIDPIIERKDIAYLMGMEGVKIKCDLLHNLYNKITVDLIRKPRFYSYRTEDFIPKECKQEYCSRNNIVWSKCKSMSQALSFMFFNQHYYINKKFNETSPLKIDKSRFGVTFPSMLNELINYGDVRDRDQVLLQIHQWIDKKVDEGTVVPKSELKYESQSNSYYWRRFFKSGENEDSYICIARVCLYLYELAKKYQNIDIIRRQQFEELAIIVFCNFEKKINWGYSLVHSFEYDWDETAAEWRLFYYDEIADKKYKVIEDILYAHSYFLMKNIREKECIYINENEITDYLRKSVPLDEHKCGLIDEYVSFYCKYSFGYTTAFNNFRLLESDTRKDEGIFDELKKDVKIFFGNLKTAADIPDLTNWNNRVDAVYYRSYVPEVYVNLNDTSLSIWLYSFLRKTSVFFVSNVDLNIFLIKWELFLNIFEYRNFKQALKLNDILINERIDTRNMSVLLNDCIEKKNIFSSVKEYLLKSVKYLFE